MSGIYKKLLNFILCTSILCGCTTTRTRLLLDYQDNGQHPTPIKSYKIEKKTTTHVYSKFKEVAFPIYRSLESGEYIVANAIAYFIPLLLDLATIPFAIFAFGSSKDDIYKTKLHLQGKVVDLTNTPIERETFKVYRDGRPFLVKTDNRGIFDYTETSLVDLPPDEPVSFWFPSKGVSIVYDMPSAPGNMFKISADKSTLNPTSLPVQGKVIVLEAKNLDVSIPQHPDKKINLRRM